MKTKFSKIGLPIMVFMMAIAFAFASVSTTKVEDVPSTTVPGYIFQNGKCEQVTTCSTTGGPLCTFGGIQARNRISETQCGLQNLYQLFP